MVKTYLGIEIGNWGMKAVLYKRGKIEDFFVAPLQEGLVERGCIVDWDGMYKFIKNMLKQHKIKCKNVAVVLPEEITYVRRLSLPYMTTEQLKVNLPYEFHDFLLGGKDEYYYDYAVMDTIEKEEDGKVVKYIDIMAAAVAKETIEHYKKMLKKSGLKLKMAAPPSYAYQNIVRTHMTQYKQQQKMDYAILDIGYENVGLRLFTEGKYETEKSIELGLKEIQNLLFQQNQLDLAQCLKTDQYKQQLAQEDCMAIYETIALEIMRVVNFFTYNYPNNTLEVMYCCGGGSFIEPLLEVIQNTVGLQIKPLNELFPEKKDCEEALNVAPMAVGITWN